MALAVMTLSRRITRRAGRPAMKLEDLMLRSLCVACMLVCVLVLGAMLLATPSALADSGPQLADHAATTSLCALPPDAVMCLRRPG